MRLRRFVTEVWSSAVHCKLQSCQGLSQSHVHVSRSFRRTLACVAAGMCLASLESWDLRRTCRAGAGCLGMVTDSKQHRLSYALLDNVYFALWQ